MRETKRVPPPMPPRRDTIPRQKLTPKRIRDQTHQGLEVRGLAPWVAQAMVSPPEGKMRKVTKDKPKSMNFGHHLADLPRWLIF
jgi:hypothetical protein